MEFLQRISSPQYCSTLQDYEMFFDEASEIEIGLRLKFLKNYPCEEHKLVTNNKSLTIDSLLNNRTMRSLIDFKNRTNKPWLILKSYRKGTATIIYEIGVETSDKYLKFQLVNWPQKKRCRIDDILESNDNSIFWGKE